METSLQKYEQLKKSIAGLGSAMVAFSGGVDSALVLKAAHDGLGDKATAITADSPSLPRRELQETKKIAESIGARHIIIKTQETKNEDYLKNPGNRCYFCKSELYAKLKEIAKELGIKNILNGTNLDDIGDYRPGIKAADEYKIISPLKEARITKSEVREIARHLGLKIWDKPSSPCMSSRVPYGQEITLKKLSMIEEAENFLKDLGIKELRVRHFGQKARIEVNDYDNEKIHGHFSLVEEKFNEIGFKQIEISKFRSGNLNLVINVRAGN